MTDGAAFLAVIAISTALMALIQVATAIFMMVYGGRVLKRIESLLRQMQDDMRPVSANISAITRDAARATSLAVAQVERADKVLSDVSVRLDETLTLVQSAIVTPVREGAALVAGFKAAMAALRELRDRARRRGVDDDDALFI